MPRQPRMEYPGAIYHVMSRGDRGEGIYLDDVDRQDFIKTLAEACQKTGFEVHAYCLMSNHFHLVVETPNANLVAGMRWLLSSYTLRLNHRHHLVGHVFSGRYKAILVEGSGNGYLRTACDYVHLNPVRAKLLRPQDRLLAYPWSSLLGYLAAPKHRPTWLRVERLLAEHGIAGDTAAGRREFERQMERRRREETDPAAWEPLRRGWCLGSEAFRAKLLEGMGPKLGEHHSGQRRQENDQAKTERLVAAELHRLKWDEAKLRQSPKNHPAKLALAVRLRRETTLTIRLIAQRLHMGNWKTLSNKLCLYRKTEQGRSKVKSDSLMTPS